MAQQAFYSAQAFCEFEQLGGGDKLSAASSVSFFKTKDTMPP
jgi:hypothetical protein